MKTLLNLAWIGALCSLAAGAQPLTILVHDYAGLSDSAVQDMQALSAVLLSRSGIQVEWVWCNTARRDARSSLCDGNLQRGQVMFRLLAANPDQNHRAVDPLGSAEIEGGYGSLYMAEINRTAERNGLPLGSLLAYSTVHEIGHLLLGKEHSRLGVMRGQWSKDEYRDMAQRRLTFSKAEAETMRQALSPGTK